MAKQKGKMWLPLLCIWMALGICGTFIPLSALADPSEATGIDFHIRTSLDPSAFGSAPSNFLNGLDKALDSLDLKGHAVLQNGQADIQGDLNLNGLSAIDFHATGTEERMSLVTNLFGEKPVVITLPNYMRFLLKFYYYTDVPVQYIGVFTDPYSYLHGIRPMLDKWSELTAGTESRTYSPEECVQKALLLDQSLDENEAFYYWYLGLLQHVGLDELLSEFIYSLPEWMEGIVENGGLTIQVTDAGENWTLGGETVYTLRREGNKTTWQVSLPPWEGFRLLGQCALETRENGLQISMDWRLLEGDEVSEYLSLAGEGLPDGRQMQGEGKITVSLGGASIGADQIYMAGLKWDQRQNGETAVLDGQVALLDPATGKTMFTVDGQVSWGSTNESFQPKTKKEIRGIDFFCMNDSTIREFYANAKWPLIRAAIPFVLELPASLLNGAMDWMDENGLLLTVMEGLGE